MRLWPTAAAASVSSSYGSTRLLFASKAGSGAEGLAGLQPVHRRRVGLRQFVRRHVGGEDHVAGARGRFRQRAVRRFARPRVAGQLERPPVALGEQHVVDDGLRRRAPEEVDEVAVHHARPRPAADQRLHAADAAVVDGDQHDVRPGGRRVRREAHAEVVRLELDGLQERGQPEQPGQQRRRRAERDADADVALVLDCVTGVRSFQACVPSAARPTMTA